MNKRTIESLEDKIAELVGDIIAEYDTEIDDLEAKLEEKDEEIAQLVEEVERLQRDDQIVM